MCVNNITVIGSNESNQTFNYDVLSRLVNFRNKTTANYQNFGYDGNGNRLTQNQEINRSREFTYADNTNMLANIKHYHMIDENTTEITKDINYTYDKMGNIIKDEKHTYGYDGRNRLISIDDNIKYNYNHNNRRVTKIVNGVTTYFIYEGHMLLGEYNKDGNVINEYVYFGSSPIAMISDEKTYKIYSDHLNTPRRVADEDSKIVWKWESTPFGETKPIGTLEFNLRFSGQYFDSETGTHYNINRDYNPVTGRYIQSDPIGLDGGFSTFAYVDGNPVLFVDLEGLWIASEEEDKPKIVIRTERTRLNSCKEDDSYLSAEAVWVEKIKKFDKKVRNGRFNSLNLGWALQNKYGKNLDNFWFPCIYNIARNKFYNIVTSYDKRSTVRFILKVIYKSTSEPDSPTEIRYKNGGQIEVWQTKKITTYL